MKDNKDIFNEASFFKKNQTYADRQKSKMPQYQPVDVKTPGKTPVADGALQVTSTQEVKKRLAGTFGATFGNNNIKGMASRATKTFPIIISDNIEPETAITLKKLMEDQYAEYINLLISNQVVNLTDFRAGNTDGNIAIQALDSISGSDFSSTRAADIANRTGEIKGDDIFSNIPLYNLLRESNQVLTTGDSIIDTLLENAIVVPNEYADNVVRYMQNHGDEIASLMESPEYTPMAATPSYVNSLDPSVDNIDRNRKAITAKNIKLSQYMSDLNPDDDEHDIATTANVRDMNRDVLRGYQGLDAEGKEIYTKLTTADVIINKQRLDQAINKSVGELLTRPENVEIRDKFEKATMLLQSNRIAGMEYYQYCVLRLGIPVSEDARKTLATRFPISNVLSARGYDTIGASATGSATTGFATLNPKEIAAIANNRRTIVDLTQRITEVPFSRAIMARNSGIGAGVGAAGGAVAGVTLGTSMMFLPLGIGILAGATVGGLGYVLTRHIRNRRIARQNAKIDAENQAILNRPDIEGWERVEALINQWDDQQARIRQLAANSSVLPSINRTKNSPNEVMSYDYNESKEKLKQAEDASNQAILARKYLENIDMAKKNFNRVLTESATLTESPVIVQTFNPNLQIKCPHLVEELQMELINTCKEVQNDKELLEQIKYDEINYMTLQEKKAAATKEEEKEYGDTYLTTQTVMDINNILKGNARQNVAVRYIDKQDDKDVLITPQFMATDNFAYGTTEIERKENKDRRYNQPLIMTVKFRGRFQDDKFSDNELTAVIGILGKVIRVSSNEMEYILKENTQGNTIEGFFKNSKGDLANTISDLLATSKISKDLKNLPQSADIWHNLEKVATLAAANKISGKRNKNIANAHIVFSQKEIDNVRNDLGIDYLKDIKKSVALMKRYSAFTIMVANDPGQRLYILDDQDAISWNAVPYSAIVGKESGDQLSAFLNKMTRLS